MPLFVEPPPVLIQKIQKIQTPDQESDEGVERERKTILFLHIPKTGGTSIEHYFKTMGYFNYTGEYLYTPWEKFMECSLKRGVRCSLQHLTFGEIKGIVPGIMNKITDVLVVVRDPYDRLVSEYWYLRKKVFVGERDYEIWGMDPSTIKRALSNFDDFVEEMYSLYKKEPNVMDNHFLPQSRFIEDLKDYADFYKKIKIQYFSSLKDGSIFPFLQKEYFPGSNQRMAPKSIHKNRETPTDKESKITWSEATETRIREWYEEDFVLFHFPYRNLKTNGIHNNNLI